MSSLEDFGAKSWDALREKEIDDDTGDVVCPVADQPITATKGTIEVPVARLDDDRLRARLEDDGVEYVRSYGHKSPYASVLIPTTVSNERANGFSSKYVGVRAEFRDDVRFIPVRMTDLPDDLDELLDDDDGHQRTRVGRWFDDDCSIYAGRAGNDGEKDMLSAEIGERGWLGNPYPADEFGREECISMFTDALLLRVEEDADFRRELVDRVRGETLGCYCHGLDEDGPTCHADVIARVVDSVILPKNPAVVEDGGDGQ